MFRICFVLMDFFSWIEHTIPRGLSLNTALQAFYKDFIFEKIITSFFLAFV